MDTDDAHWLISLVRALSAELTRARALITVDDLWSVATDDEADAISNCMSRLAYDGAVYGRGEDCPHCDGIGCRRCGP